MKSTNQSQCNSNTVSVGFQNFVIVEKRKLQNIQELTINIYKKVAQVPIQEFYKNK